METFTLALVVQLLILGIAVGLISNGLGIGGGLLMVPAFLEFVPGMDVHTARGSSLFIIIFVALINTWRLNAQRHGVPPEWRLAALLSGGAVAGSYLSAWGVSVLPEETVTWFFVAFVILMGLRIIFVRGQQHDDMPIKENTLLTLAIGLLTGVISGATGVGGGGIMVPLVLLAHLAPNNRIVAVSNMVMIPTCIAATLAHLPAEQQSALPGTIGQVNIALAPLILVGSLVGGPAGRWVNKHLTLRRRRITMGLLLLVIAVRMIYRATS